MDETKIAPSLLARLSAVRAFEAAEAVRIPVIIRYRPNVLRTQSVKPGLEAKFVYKLTPTAAVEATGRDIDELTEDDQIEYIWLDEEVHTWLDRSLSQIGVPAVWQAGYRGAGIKLAIVDTGLDTSHPCFAGRVAAGASFVGGGFEDENGHGTHVASTAAGGQTTQGPQYVGVAPEAQLYIARVLDRNGSGSMSGVMAGVEWAVDQNVHVINMSLGGSIPSDGQDALSLTCNAAVGQGVVVCVAAGNAGPSTRTVGSPGAATDVITVGAVNRNNNIASFSSRGPTTDGRTKPDVCAPGTDIVAARATGTGLGVPVDDYFTAVSGTSMATPHVAGLAALLRQAKPSLTPAEMKQALMETALDLGQDANAQGAGVVRAEQALQFVLGQTPTPGPTPGPTPTPTPGEPKGCLPTFLIPLVGR